MSDAEDTEAVPTPTETSEATETLPQENIPYNESTLEEKAVEQSSEQDVPDKRDADGDPANEEEEDGTETKGDEHATTGSSDTAGKKSQACPPPRSRCRARSRDTRQCKKHFREMIGKHEIRNDDLEQRETDLRQRLEMLESSMPAVMVWNIWRMAQGAPVSQLRDVVQKQFLGPATGISTCPTTPSQHWDCRVREIEAERKQAQRRAEEARQVFAIKDDTLKIQKQQIEEAKKLQEDRKLQVSKLEEEVKCLQEALQKAQGDENFCETGECGEIRCRQMWLQGVSSASSIHSTDLECLARLQDLAEAEICMKRQIADLERRECAYMRTLQQADEMWAKMEDDNANSLGDLKGQLEAKIAANQQLADRIVELEDQIEKLRSQLNKTTAALSEYTEKTFTDASLGDVDVSTVEKKEQTEEIEEIKDTINGDAKNEAQETKSHETGISLKSDEAEKRQKIMTQQDEATEYAPPEEIYQDRIKTEKKSATAVNEVVREKLSVPVILSEQVNSKQAEYDPKVTTAGESVQVKPEFEEVETQSMPSEPSQEKETTEVQAQFQSASEVEIKREVSSKHSIRQQQEIISPSQTSRSKDRGSLAHLLKAPTEDKDTQVPVDSKIIKSLVDREEGYQENPPAADKTPEIVAALETDTKTVSPPASRLTVKADLETAPDLSEFKTSEPSPIGIIDEPHADADTAKIVVTPTASISEPIKEVTTVLPSEPVIEAPSVLVKLEPRVEAAYSPTYQQTFKAEREDTSDTLIIPIQTILSWYRITACLQRQILICPRCSSANGEIKKMLEEIKTYMGKEAPDLSEVKCPKTEEDAKNSETVTHKKGPCICKPNTCPLERIPGTTSAEAQASVRIQTVVDEHSQTSIPVRIPSRENRNSKSNKGWTKNKEELKLTSIDEGTEPDRVKQRSGSIPHLKDEATVTVGDIGSQTETVRKALFPPTKADDKACVCPTGVCPKNKLKIAASHGKCTPGKLCTSTKQVQQIKEYKSTADAILAPAIKVLPLKEDRQNAQTNGSETYNINSESSTSACCICGKPVTPVSSKKATAIPTKSSFRSKVMVASENSDNDFLCCTCKEKNSSGARPKGLSASKTSEKFSESARVSHREKPPSGIIKMSCSRDVCCPCDEQETHVILKSLIGDSEVSGSKTKPETKDVCCLVKISRDKSSKTESQQRKDIGSVKTAAPSTSSSVSGQISSSSSTYKESKTTESSSSNVCCSSIEQVVGTISKTGKGSKCICDGQTSKGPKKKCACGEDNQSKLTNNSNDAKHTKSGSCCPPGLFSRG